jgi:hypothetical protein
VHSRDLWLALALALAAPAWAEPSRPEVEQAARAVQQHPDIGGVKTERSLRWKPREESQRRTPSGGVNWLSDLVRWINESARILMWLGGLTALAVFLVGLRRWLQLRRGAGLGALPERPTHIQDLDIRPESLPDAIGPAAAQLWRAGRQREALALLYRGALSRLVHGHAVPIAAASTEGECVALARGRLPPQPVAYFEQLVQAWQLAVYGARMPDTPRALALCDAFDAQLQPPAHGSAP